MEFDTHEWIMDYLPDLHSTTLLKTVCLTQLSVAKVLPKG